MLKKKGVVIVDENNTEESKEIVAKLGNELKLYYKVNPDVGGLSKSAYNIRIIHDHEYYDENEKDPHADNLKGYIVQHMTEEAEHFLKENSSPDIKKIIQELIIKGDVRDRRISIYDWTRLNAGKKWSFVLRKKAERVPNETTAHNNHYGKTCYDYYHYYRLTIDTEGKLEFDTFCDKRTKDESEEWFKICYAYDKVISDTFGMQNEVDGLVYSSIDNIHAILLTKEQTLPNISEIGKALEETNGKLKIPKEKILEAIEAFEKENQGFGDNISKWRKAFSNEPKMVTKEKVKKCLNLRSRAGKAFNRFFHQKYNIWIYSEIRHGDFEATYEMSNLINIKYAFNTDQDSGNNSFIYYVGGKSKKLSYPNACRVRKVISLGNKLEYIELLPLMAVEFVRNDQYTVLPFPYKYLREYIEKNEDYPS